VERERVELAEKGVRVDVLGDLRPLSEDARRAVDTIESTTSAGRHLRLHLAISYGGRDEIVRAARRLAERCVAGDVNASKIDAAAFASELYTAGIPDPDLLLRTSGEMRVSNFLLWQIAYAEIHVTPVLWPDFGETELYEAVLDYQRRERRFGRVQR
jgi:undecaprenyl diphosphate synthase